MCQTDTLHVNNTRRVHNPPSPTYASYACAVLAGRTLLPVFFLWDGIERDREVRPGHTCPGIPPSKIVRRRSEQRKHAGAPRRLLV